MHDLLRRLPAVSRLLAEPELAAAIPAHGRRAVTAAARQAVADLRAAIRAGEVTPEELPHRLRELPRAALDRLAAQAAGAYPAVINATGVLLHTNLGRAPLPGKPPGPFASYLALEYDLEEGRRGERLAPLRRRLAELVGAEAAVVTNNNAAAVLLLLAAHCAGREVVVSRGQLIEIGGSFRLPEIMAASGARLVEVGCTNRTHLADYEGAIGEATAAILVVHPSNYRIVGFTAQPPLSELAALAHRWGLPLFVDQGSGAIHPLERWGLPHEPTVGELLADGADAVCCSGDKLLGGPQAGLVMGAARWVEPLGRHPLLRAVRPDKTALVLLDRVLAAHRDGRLHDVPLYRLLAVPEAELRRRARRLARRLAAGGIAARAVATRAVLGGGTAPGATLPSWGIALPGGHAALARLRRARPPVVGRAEGDAALLDLRAVPAEQDRELERAVLSVLGGGG